MELSREKVANAVLENKTTEVAKMLEGFGLKKGNNPPVLTSGSKDLAISVLGLASAMDYDDKLNHVFADELIGRTAMAVDIFRFLHLVVAAMEIKADSFDVIPKKIRTAIRKCKYTSEAAAEIEAMSDEAFNALIVFMLSEDIERVHIRFNCAIIRRIYKDEIIPADLIFAFMGLSLRDAVDERIRGIIPGGIVISLCDIADEEEEDEDEEG